MDQRFAVVTMFAAAVLLSGCDQNVGPAGMRPSAPQAAPREASPPAPAATAEAPPPPQGGGAGASAAGITWTKPARWVALGERMMRAATYRVPAAKGDAEDGECAVFFFGPGQGGDIDANLKRWIGQFEQPGGKSSESAAKTAKQTINGLSVTTVDLSGTYLASAGPMSPVKEKKANYRLQGAIVEAPQGNVFFKMTGPVKTIEAANKEFEILLKSLQKK